MGQEQDSGMCLEKIIFHLHTAARSLINLLRIQASVPSQSDWLEAFTVFDVHNTGKISPDELKSILTSMGEQFSATEVDQLLKDAVIDADGKIDYQQWTNKLIA